MTKIVSRLEFSRLAGVTPAAITKACRGKLAPACVDDRIDQLHEAAVQYLAGKRGNRPRSDQEPTSGPKGALQTDAAETSGLMSFGHRTLYELVGQFGSARSMRDWLDALRKIEDVREKRLSNEETERTLIRRDLVRQHVFGALDGLSRRLLGDTAKAIARRVHTEAKAGRTVAQSEETVRELLSSQLRAVVERAKNSIRG